MYSLSLLLCAQPHVLMKIVLVPGRKLSPTNGGASTECGLRAAVTSAQHDDAALEPTTNRSSMSDMIYSAIVDVFSNIPSQLLKGLANFRRKCSATCCVVVNDARMYIRIFVRAQVYAASDRFAAGCVVLATDRLAPVSCPVGAPGSGGNFSSDSDGCYRRCRTESVRSSYRLR